MSLVFERIASEIDENDIARRWWGLPVGCILPLLDGGRYQLLYAGYPGGPAGPDVRDAVLRSLPARTVGSADGQMDVTLSNDQVGNVEFHVRASDWFAHCHNGDARYNNVILHVILLCDAEMPALRQDGTSVPTCSLYDLPATMSMSGSLPPFLELQEAEWPCQRVLALSRQEERDKLLECAGLLRFEQKAHAFVEQLHAVDRSAGEGDAWDTYERCLLPALAEALAYGRDREFFRAVGYRLLNPAIAVPEPLGRAASPPRLDAARLRSLYVLAQRVHDHELWCSWHVILQSSQESRILHELRALLRNTGLSLARSDIILCNVILPFAAAVALVENDVPLFERALRLYCAHTGLPSNHVTRQMTLQLQLAREPSGSCRQQGLHYIYQENCREKRCATCMAGKWNV